MGANESGEPQRPQPAEEKTETKFNKKEKRKNK